MDPEMTFKGWEGVTVEKLSELHRKKLAEKKPGFLELNKTDPQKALLLLHLSLFGVECGLDPNNGYITTADFDAYECKTIPELHDRLCEYYPEIYCFYTRTDYYFNPIFEWEELDYSTIY